MSKNGPAYHQAPEAIEGYATAYIYRSKIGYQGVLGYVSTYIDGKLACGLGQGNYCYLYLVEGWHRFGMGTEQYVDIELKAGESIYVQMRDSLSLSGGYFKNDNAALYGIYTVIEKEKALEEISQLMIYQPKSVK